VTASPGSTRRTFLLAGGTAAGALALPACSSTKGAASAPPSGAGLGSGDVVVAGLAVALENLLVNSYQSALDAASGGKLGAIPPAIATLAATAQRQHREHAAGWNSLLTGAGKPAVTGVDLTVKALVVDPGLARMKNAADLARFALALENIAASTYLNAIEIVLQASSALKMATTIYPVEMQHAAILSFVLGQYPVPDSFAKTDGARPASDEIGQR